MKKFVLINIRDEKEVKKHQNNRSLKQSILLPYYREGYVCFSSNKDFSFEELTDLFLQGNEDEEIGAISIIVESYPYELYKFLCDRNHHIPSKKLKFLLDVVIPSYLPLILPNKKLKDYNFSEDFSNDIWVDILTVIRSRL